MKEPVLEKTFLRKMIWFTAIIQSGTTLFLIAKSVMWHASFVSVNWNLVDWKIYIAILILQFIVSMLLLRSMLQNPLRRKAWFIWFTTFFLGRITITSIGGMNINSSLTLFGVPMLLTCIVLIIASHRYTKNHRIVKVQ